MKNKNFLVFAVLALFVARQALAGDYNNFSTLSVCQQIKKKVGINVSGRFGWKPMAAHFPAAVVLGPRLYNVGELDYWGPPEASLVSPVNGRILLRMRLKSNGKCDGKGEDLCAAAYVTPSGWTGMKVQQKFGAVIVRLKPRGSAFPSGKGCRYYYIPRPKDRIQYVNQ